MSAKAIILAKFHLSRTKAIISSITNFVAQKAIILSITNFCFSKSNYIVHDQLCITKNMHILGICEYQDRYNRHYSFYQIKETLLDLNFILFQNL